MNSNVQLSSMCSSVHIFFILQTRIALGDDQRIRTFIKYEQMMFTARQGAHITYIDVAGQSDMEIEKRRDKKRKKVSHFCHSDCVRFIYE